jgi:16S rRNA (guanine966-N2)-methyltransferase
MQTQLRIVSGLLRGRKLTCNVEPTMRPMPDRVREALFSILTSEIANKPFFDLFAGTGAVGMEALSRGSIPVTFVEFNGKTASEIIKHLKAFDVEDKAQVLKADFYRWATRWPAPTQPVTVFIGPPYPDLTNRCDDLLSAIAAILDKLPPDSVLVLQTEKDFDEALLPEPASWRHRLYGRTRLSFWRSGDPKAGPSPEEE